VKLLDELEVISVPPSGNSICRQSAKTIWTLFPAAADGSYFQTAVDTDISTSHLNRQELLPTGKSIKLENTLKLRNSTGKNR